MREFEVEPYRNVAFAVILDAVENIIRKKVNVDYGTDYKKDLAWIYSEYSTYELWCEVIDLSPHHLRDKFKVR